MLNTFDDYDLSKFTDVVANFGEDRYGFVVTPNTDHLIRFHEDETFRKLYSDASYILLDSRFLAYLFRMTRGIKIPVCPGSDLTTTLFEKVVRPNDKIVLIGASESQASSLKEKFHLQELSHYNPPMGFIKNPEEVEKCLDFVESHSPFRFCLIAVGSPQQEVVASRLRERGVARGLALCIGASVDFLTGAETRAPGWMQAIGSEWLYRLLQNPKRMWRRYLVRGPRIFGLLNGMQIQVRPAESTAVSTAP